MLRLIKAIVSCTSITLTLRKDEEMQKAHTPKRRSFPAAATLLATCLAAFTTAARGEYLHTNPIPPEALIQKAYFKHPLPPQGFTSTIGWMQAFHDGRKEISSKSSSKILIDWMRLYARVNGEDVLLASDEYSNPSPGEWFELYQRNPWLGKKDREPLPMEHNAKNGWLILTPSDWPDRVGHWWNAGSPRPTIPTGAQLIWMECRVRIEGPALVQAGIDHWKSPTAKYAGPNVNNVEAGASNWHFASPEWQTITVPQRPSAPVGLTFGKK